MIYTDTEEWLEGRSHGIGGSEASIVMGINPWKSRLELWDEKVNRTRRLEYDTHIALKLGNFLEPLIAEEYSKITGRKLEIRPQKAHSEYPFILGNIDREIIGDDKRGPGILEIKSKGAFTDWHREDVPLYYIVQLQQYLEIYRYDWGSFAIFDLGSLKLSCIDIERDEELINKLIKEEVEFWRLVESKTPPNICPTKACGEFLREKYKISEDITIDLSENEDAIKWAAMLREAKRNIKAFDAMETEAKNHLMSMVGSAEKAVGEGFSVTWKAPRDKEVFDLERFKREYPELAKQYTKAEPQTRRFTVKFSDDKQIKSGKKDKQIKGKEVGQIDNRGLNIIKGLLDEEL